MQDKRIHPDIPKNAATAFLLVLPLLTGALCGMDVQGPPADAGTLDGGERAPVDAGPPRVPDETPPMVAILRPTETCLTGDVRFEAKAIDEDAGIGVVAMKFASRILSVESSAQDVFHADFNVDNLFTGTYVLIVTAIDLENNRSEVEHRFGVARDGEYLQEEGIECGTPPPPPATDETPPSLQLLSPSPAFTTHVGDMVSITISVEDESAPLEAYAEIGDIRVVFDETSRLRSVEFPTADLPEGPASLRVVAVDGVGNEAAFTHDLLIDHTPPSVSIASPLADSEVVAFTDVVADIEDNNGIARVRLFEVGQSEPLGSVSQPSNASRWGVIYRLPCEGLPREVSFLMQAEDYAQNIGRAEVRVRVLQDGCSSE